MRGGGGRREEGSERGEELTRRWNGAKRGGGKARPKGKEKRVGPKYS